MYIYEYIFDATSVKDSSRKGCLHVICPITYILRWFRKSRIALTGIIQGEVERRVSTRSTRRSYVYVSRVSIDLLIRATPVVFQLDLPSK